MNLQYRTIIVVAFAIGVSMAAPVPATVISTFDSNLEGWRDPDIRFVSRIGNPPGAMEFQELYSSNSGFASAPAEFLGDWSLLDGAGSISFEHRVSLAGIHPGFWGTSVPREIRLAGPGGSATWMGAQPAFSNAWAPVIAPLSPAAWTVTSGIWPGLLSNVTSFELRVDHFNDFFGAERTQFDNIGLSGPSEPIPEPSTFLLLGTGSVLILYRRYRARGVARPGIDL
jgi:hypothetical protein